MSLDDIPGVVLTELAAHADARGRFTEIMRTGEHPDEFVQSNHSRSAAGVLRGLHYHRRQADLWYVVSGRVEVGLADLRTPGPAPATALVTLSDDEPATLYIPAGVAHGFLTLTPVDVVYHVTNYYDSTDEHGIAWNDPTLGLPWSASDPILSERDASNPELRWDEIAPFT